MFRVPILPLAALVLSSTNALALVQRLFSFVRPPTPATYTFQRIVRIVILGYCEGGGHVSHSELVYRLYLASDASWSETQLR